MRETQRVARANQLIREIEADTGPMDEMSKALIRACYGSWVGPIPPIEDDPVAMELGLVPRKEAR